MAERETAAAAADGGGWTIGRWRFDPVLGSLTCGGECRRLERRAALTLILLCRRRGEVIGRQELLDEVWQGRSVSANSVAVVIADLRRALDDNAKASSLIVTVARSGYRLEPEPAQPARAKRRQIPARAATSIVAAIIGLVVALVLLRPEAAKHEMLAVAAVRNETGTLADAPLAQSLGVLEIDRLARDPRLSVVTAGREADPPALLLSSKLVLWNGLPTLHMMVTQPATGRVIWSGMAVADADHIASRTLTALSEMTARIHLRPEKS